MKALGAKQRANLMFRAFSDPIRLRVLHLLQSGGELCVGDLVSILRVPQPTASRHLSYLRKAGLVVTRKAGQWMFYALAPAEAPFHEKLLECLACCADEVPALERDRRRAAKLSESGGCCPE